MHFASRAPPGRTGPVKQIRTTHLFQYTFALHKAIMMAIRSPGIAIFLDAEYDGTEWWNLAARYAYEAIDNIGNAKNATQENNLIGVEVGLRKKVSRINMLVIGFPRM